MKPDERRRFVAALDFAALHHSGQKRKGKNTPYVSHVISVAGIVMENGGDIDQAIAALLHDILEDCDEVTPKMLVENFGEDVASMVDLCTDTLPGDSAETKSPWKLRKDRFLERLKTASLRSVLVSAADKRHNLGAIVADLREHGRDSLNRFHATAEQQRWYFAEIIRIGGNRIPTRIRTELESLLAEYCDLAGLPGDSDQAPSLK
jgi:(p)ppGpp synthase/HD superfamily hydrolase